MGFLRAPADGWRKMGARILEPPMTRHRRRKCRNCGKLYEPDPRNLRHQRYCSQPACRQVSKAASQRRWRASPKGRDYFHGSANVARVRAWRKAHPGYWRRRRKTREALQDHCSAQVLVPVEDKSTLDPRALQDVIATQGFALTGLVAQLSGGALQEDIASTTQRLILLGRQIQGPRSGRRSDGRSQTSAVPAAIAARSAAVQLDRPPSGPG